MISSHSGIRRAADRAAAISAASACLPGLADRNVILEAIRTRSRRSAAASRFPASLFLPYRMYSCS